MRVLSNKVQVFLDLARTQHSAVTCMEVTQKEAADLAVKVRRMDPAGNHAGIVNALTAPGEGYLIIKLLPEVTR